MEKLHESVNKIILALTPVWKIFDIPVFPYSNLPLLPDEDMGRQKLADTPEDGHRARNIRKAKIAGKSYIIHIPPN
jgi:hypothetical protein